MKPTPATSFARSAAVAAAAASLFTSLLPAQAADASKDAVPAALPRTASPIAPATAPTGEPAGLWAHGAAYKVSFHDGMTFYPYVGRDLPHQPVRWRTASVRAGDTELLRTTRQPAPSSSGFRCEYDLGVVTERYDVRTEGVEQSFVVHERPAAGDLVITGEITTPLVLPAMAPAHGGLSLCLPDGRAVVDYGAAIAFDRHGVQMPVLTATDGNRILLRVAAEHVAAASFPLVIDPLLAQSVALGFGPVIEDVDVLHETRTDPLVGARTWYTWSEEVAAGDRDVHMWRAESDLLGALTQQYREITTWDATHPRIALAPASDRVVLVFSLDTGAAGRFINLHSHSVFDNNLVTGFNVFVPQTSVNFKDWRPDVGGRVGGGSKVLITFQREDVASFANTDTSEVWATVFDTGVFPMSSAFTVQPFVLLPRSNWDQERPAVNQSAGSANWLVAFQELNNNPANDDWDVTTLAVASDGVVTATNLDVAEASTTNPTLHKINPDISGSAGRFLLTYTTREFELPNPKPTGVLGSVVHAQRIDWDHATGTGSLPHPMVTLTSFTSNIFANSGLAFDWTSESHWCSMIRVESPQRYRVSKLGYRGDVVESQLITQPAGIDVTASAVTFNQELRTFPVLYTENDGTLLTNRLEASMMQYVPAPPPTLTGFACGSGVWAGLDATGKRTRIGSQAMPLRLANAPQDTVALLFVSMGLINFPADPLGAPGCVLVPDIVTPGVYLGALNATIVNGAALLTLDLPEYLLPFSLELQWAYLVPGANPLGLQASEGLTVTVAR